MTEIAIELKANGKLARGDIVTVRANGAAGAAMSALEATDWLADTAEPAGVAAQPHAAALRKRIIELRKFTAPGATPALVIAHFHRDNMPDMSVADAQGYLDEANATKAEMEANGHDLCWCVNEQKEWAIFETDEVDEAKMLDTDVNGKRVNSVKLDLHFTAKEVSDWDDAVKVIAPKRGVPLSKLVLFNKV